MLKGGIRMRFWFYRALPVLAAFGFIIAYGFRWG